MSADKLCVAKLLLQIGKESSLLLLSLETPCEQTLFEKRIDRATYYAQSHTQHCQVTVYGRQDNKHHKQRHYIAHALDTCVYNKYHQIVSVMINLLVVI